MGGVRRRGWGRDWVRIRVSGIGQWRKLRVLD